MTAEKPYRLRRYEGAHYSVKSTLRPISWMPIHSKDYLTSNVRCRRLWSHVRSYGNSHAQVMLSSISKVDDLLPCLTKRRTKRQTEKIRVSSVVLHDMEEVAKISSMLWLHGNSNNTTRI